MKYFCLVLVAWSLYLMGTQSQNLGCHLVELNDFSIFCNKSNPVYMKFPSLTNCSQYYDCASNGYASCDSNAPYYEPFAQTCNASATVCLYSSLDVYTGICPFYENEYFFVMGNPLWWVYCSGSGLPLPAQCQNTDGNPCVLDSYLPCPALQ